MSNKLEFTMRDYLVALTSLMLTFQIASANTLNVMPIGSDSGADGSIANPFGTIQAAAQTCLQGDTVLVNVGFYIEEIELDDSIANSVTILGVDGSNAFLSAPGDKVFDIEDCDNLTIQSLTIQNCKNAIYAKNSDSLRVSNCLITDCSSEAIKINNSHTESNLVISDNVIRDCSKGLYIKKARGHHA
jgi:hypothetical protein